MVLEAVAAVEVVPVEVVPQVGEAVVVLTGVLSPTAMLLVLAVPVLLHQLQTLPILLGPSRPSLNGLT